MYEIYGDRQSNKWSFIAWFAQIRWLVRNSILNNISFSQATLTLNYACLKNLLQYFLTCQFDEKKITKKHDIFLKTLIIRETSEFPEDSLISYLAYCSSSFDLLISHKKSHFGTQLEYISSYRFIQTRRNFSENTLI